MHVKESNHESSPLYDYSGQHKVKADTAITVSLHERHEKTETNEDHDMDILEHCSDTETNPFALRRTHYIHGLTDVKPRNNIHSLSLNLLEVEMQITVDGKRGIIN